MKRRRSPSSGLVEVTAPEESRNFRGEVNVHAAAIEEGLLCGEVGVVAIALAEELDLLGDDLGGGAAVAVLLVDAGLQPAADSDLVADLEA